MVHRLLTKSSLTYLLARPARLPGSKSLSNRILLLAALAQGATVVENLLDRCFC